MIKKRKHKNKGLIPDRMIVCRDCGIEQHSKQYQWRVKDNAEYKTLDTTQCRKCRNHHVRIINALKKEHPYPIDSVCEICNEVKKLALDHNHKPPYEFRGWLCSKCNTGMGKLNDSIELLQKAIDYLKK